MFPHVIHLHIYIYNIIKLIFMSKIMSLHRNWFISIYFLTATKELFIIFTLIVAYKHNI